MTEINKKNDLSVIPPTNNDGDPYVLPLDIFKEGYSAYNISNWFKGRVGDNGTPFAIRWYSHGRLLNILGMRPFIEGQVGDYTIDDSDPDNPQINMAEDASHIHIVGDVDDSQEGGIAIYRLISQAFPKSGIFYGKIGFMGTQDDGTLVNTGVDIVFKVLSGHMNMLGARRFYVTELEKAWLEMQSKIKQYNQEYKNATDKQAEQFKADTEKALADLNTKIANEIKRAEDTLGDTQASIDQNISALKKLCAEIVSLQTKLETEDVITISQYNKDLQANRNLIQQKLADISTNIEGFPTANDLKTKYPAGKQGIFMAMDTGHGFVWWNNAWTDCGQLMTLRDTGQAIYKPYIDSLPLKEHPDAEIHPGDASWWAFNKIYPAGYVSYVSLTITGTDDQKAIVGLVEKDTNKVMALQEANGHGKLIINFNKVIDKDFYILIKATNFKFTNEKNGIDFMSWQIKTGDTGYDYVHLGQDMNPQWQSGDYTPYLDVAYISISEQLIKIKNQEFKGLNDTQLDFNKYLNKGGYFFGMDATSTDKLQHAPNNDTWGYYSLIVLPINPSFYVQIATSYNAEHGKCFAIRYIGKNSDGSMDTSNPPLNEWINLYNGSLPFKGSNTTQLDFNKYLDKGGYFFGMDATSTDKLQHAPNNDTWGYYSLIVLPINPSFYVQIATSYNAEHGKCFAIRYIGKNSDGSMDTSNPPLNEWIIIHRENLSHNQMFIAGDSITAGHPYEDNLHLAYANEIARSLKFNVTRGARNGSGWLYEKGGTSGRTIVESTNFSAYDVALFAFGTNDYGNDQPLGQLGDIYPEQKTFYGTVEYCIKKIYQSNPHIVLILSTPLLRVDHGDPSTQYALKFKNGAGFTLNQYIEAEIEICKKYNIPYIDNRISPFNILSAPNLLVDQLHPTEEGYHVLGAYLAAKVGSIIKPYVE